MQQFQNNENRWFYFFLGMLYALYLFYLRLFIVRIPHKIIFYWNVWYFILYVFLMCVFFYLCKKEAYRLIYWTIDYKESSFFFVKNMKEKFFSKIFMLYNNSMDALYYYLIDDNPIGGHQIKAFILKIIFFIGNLFIRSTYLSQEKTKLKIYIFFLLMPRFFVAIAFFLDIVIFQEFFYFYKVLWLLLITLTWKFFFYLFKEQLEHQILCVYLFFDIQFSEEEDRFFFSPKNLTEEIKKKYAFTQTAEVYDQMPNNYVFFDFVDKNFVKYFEDGGIIQKVISIYPFFVSITNLLLCISWLYLVLRLLIRLIVGSYLLLNYELLLLV